MLKLLFRTDKSTEETHIVGQTKKEGKELDIIQRTLASDGGAVVKNKDGDFSSSTYIVEAHNKDIVSESFAKNWDIDNQD